MWTNSSSVRPSGTQETFKGIHHKYKYSNDQVASWVRSGKSSPLHDPVPVNNGNLCFCSICYNYYPTINKCTCCNNSVCTECLAATVDPKLVRCPMCRSQRFAITPNLRSNQVTNAEPNEEPIQLPDLPDELICYSLEYPMYQDIVVKLHKNGASKELIISIINLAVQKPQLKPESLLDLIGAIEMDEIFEIISIS